MARGSKLLDGYKLFLSPSIKPVPQEMASIVQCSGGEVLDQLPLTPSPQVLIVASADDLGMLTAAMAAGVPAHSTELILGGVLRQELDLESYPPHFSICSTPHYGVSVSGREMVYSTVECCLVAVC